ncbi:hypothetical protein HispidOSU_022221 [Sigmodon hispidus]
MHLPEELRGITLMMDLHSGVGAAGILGSRHCSCIVALDLQMSAPDFHMENVP